MRKWWPLAAVCLGSFMLITDTTVVTVALPDMARDLNASLSGLQWVMNIYTLVLAALTLSAGSLGDLFGRRRVYLLSLCLFGAASLLCALAPGAGLLIAARGLQGVGGSAVFVTGMAVLGGMYQDRARATALGVWSAVVGAAAAAGPVLGGLLTQALGWQAVFYINVPLTVLTVVLTAVSVEEAGQRERASVDLPGILSFGLCSGALTFALIKAGADGWTAPATLVPAALSALALLVFLGVERRRARPMLDLALFRNGSFLAVMFGTITSAWAFACLVYTSLWLQSALRLGPIRAGLAMLPLAAATFVTSTLTGKRLHGTAPRLVLTVAFALTGAGCAVNGLLLQASSHWTALLPGLLLMGTGVGLGMPATTAAALAAVPVTRAGMASGALATFRQLGQALGVAVLGLFFAGRAGAAGLSRVYLVTAGLVLLSALFAFRRTPDPAKSPQSRPTSADSVQA
ncbi:MFS transporter [Streptomyces orinoci]|uniref:MFS transporter n=1 Tax=Streptomyces orinoci TaxID=67339 RepID=A0ABV3JS12_STRON|nr:MFS transporter [Streptomyces orinoci]